MQIYTFGVGVRITGRGMRNIKPLNVGSGVCILFIP